MNVKERNTEPSTESFQLIQIREENWKAVWGEWLQSGYRRIGRTRRNNISSTCGREKKKRKMWLYVGDGERLECASISVSLSVYAKLCSDFEYIFEEPCQEGVTAGKWKQCVRLSPATELLFFRRDSQIICVPLGLVPTLWNKSSFLLPLTHIRLKLVSECVHARLLYGRETLKSPLGSQAILWAWWSNVGEKRRKIINGFMLRRQPST